MLAEGNSKLSRFGMLGISEGVWAPPVDFTKLLIEDLLQVLATAGDELEKRQRCACVCCVCLMYLFACVCLRAFFYYYFFRVYACVLHVISCLCVCSSADPLRGTGMRVENVCRFLKSPSTSSRTTKRVIMCQFRVPHKTAVPNRPPCFGGVPFTKVTSIQVRTRGPEETRSRASAWSRHGKHSSGAACGEYKARAPANCGSEERKGTQKPSD